MPLQDGSAQDDLPFSSAVGEQPVSAQDDLPFNSAVGEQPISAQNDLPFNSAVGEQPIPWNVQFSAADVEAIQKVSGICKLRSLMFDPKVKGPRDWRHILDHHTTTACQPRKQTGTCESLIVEGIDKSTERGNRFEVMVRLPNAFCDGDRISIEAVGSSTNMKGAKEDCVHKLISLLLAIGPEKVHLHPSFFPSGGEAILFLRHEAWKAHLSLFEWETSPLNWAQFSLIRVVARGPEPRWRPLAIAREAVLANYYKKVAEFEQKERDEEIVQVLFRLCGRQSDAIFYPSKVPQAQRDEETRQILARLLPPGGLKPFVLARPSLFEIVENNAEPWWGIKMKTYSPAVGGSGSSTHGIASAIHSGAIPAQGATIPASGSEGTIPASEPAAGGSQGTIPAWFSGWTNPWNEVRNEERV